MLENKEIWKDCKGYEGKYQVSSLGRVWSVKNQRVLKTYDGNGYKKVDLIAKNGKRKKEYIHRLVALAFLPTPKDGENVVNHKNGIKYDDRVENLEWTDTKGNNQHSYRVLDQINGTFPAKAVICVETGKKYRSIAEAKEDTGATSISQVCRGLRKTSGGYHWRYADEN